MVSHPLSPPLSQGLRVRQATPLVSSSNYNYSYNTTYRFNQLPKFIGARLHYAAHEFPLPANSLSTSKLTTDGNQQW